MTGFLFENKSHTHTHAHNRTSFRFQSHGIDMGDALSYTSTGYSTHSHTHTHHKVVFQQVLFDDSKIFLSCHNKHATWLAHVHTHIGSTVTCSYRSFYYVPMIHAVDHTVFNTYFRSDTWHDRWYIADRDVKKRFRSLPFFSDLLFGFCLFFISNIFFCHTWKTFINFFRILEKGSFFSADLNRYLHRCRNYSIIVNNDRMIKWIFILFHMGPLNGDSSDVYSLNMLRLIIF